MGLLNRCRYADQTAHGRNQLGSGKRLHDDGVRVDVFAILRAVWFQLSHGQDDRKRGRDGTGAQTFTYLESRISGHKNVKNRDVWHRVSYLSQSFKAIADREHLIASIHENFLPHVLGWYAVVGKQNVKRHVEES